MAARCALRSGQSSRAESPTLTATFLPRRTSPAQSRPAWRGNLQLFCFLAPESRPLPARSAAGSRDKCRARAAALSWTRRGRAGIARPTAALSADRVSCQRLVRRFGAGCRRASDARAARCPARAHALLSAADFTEARHLVRWCIVACN